MKNPVLRTLISATLFGLISGIVIVIIGLLLGWKTSTQFSDAFFWAGAIFMALGLMNLMGASTERTGSRWQDSRSADHLDPSERSKIRDADILRGRKLLVFMEISGLLLFGLSGLAILVGRLF